MKQNTTNKNTQTWPAKLTLLSYTVLQLLSSKGSQAFAEFLRLLINEAMVQKRAATLQAQSYERTLIGLEFPNRFKSRSLNTPIDFEISPQSVAISTSA